MISYKSFPKIKNRKGDVFQLLYLLIVLFIIAIVGFLFLTIDNKITGFWASSGLLNQSVPAQQSNQILMEAAPRTTDYMVFFFFLGSFVGLCISAVRTKFSPVIIGLFMLFLLITIFVASGFVNIYSGFQQAIPDTASQLTLTGFIFSKYTPLLMAVIGIILMLIMWGRQGGEYN
jgi:hypothetical protein